jgi:glycerophosphoryl diester phosphodiesterase
MRIAFVALTLLLGCLPTTLAAGAGPAKIVVAHRGASGYLPEHTLEAIAMAHAMGADYLEQDLVLSRDDVPVVLHDVHVDTVTDVARRFPDRNREDGRYYAIDFTLAELKQLRVSERFDPRTGAAVFPGRFPVGQASFEIPTLEEELQLVRGLSKSTQRTAGIYPEIKNPAWHRKQGKDISRIVLDTLARYGYRSKEDRIYLQCFDFAEVKRIRAELGYKGRLVQLLDDNKPGDPTDYDRLRTKAGLAEVARVADGIGPALRHVVAGRGDGALIVTDLVKTAHDLGLEVHPYTFRADALPDYAASFEELLHVFFFEVGVDGGFTDHPDRAAAFVRSAGSFKNPTNLNEDVRTFRQRFTVTI